MKPVLKSLAFAFLAFGAAAASAADQGAAQNLGARVASCPARVDIERGWEAQQRLLDERLAAKGLAVALPGTIISPPLPDFGERAAEVASKGSVGRPSSKAEPVDNSRM